jgi:hypothetical protein
LVAGARKLSAGNALQFWLVGLAMILMAIYVPNPFSMLFWWGVATVVVGVFFGMIGGGRRRR